MSLDTLRHKKILLQILKDIYSDTTIAPLLGFKGGTAAFMFYDLGRFSLDLDFDLLEESKEEYVFRRVEETANNYGTIKEARRKEHTLIFVLSYSEEAHNIKIEINRRQFGSQYELKTYLGIGMLVMRQEDMFAHKLMAMYERIGKTSRDIYDVWFFLQNNWPINNKIVEKRAGMSFRELLLKCIEALERMRQRRILDGMGELLTASQKDWAKAKLKSETIFLLKLLLEDQKMSE